MQYTLRDATPEDLLFVTHLHETVMRPYVESIWGWNDAQQAEFVRRDLERVPQIIVADGKDAGQVSIQRRDDEISLDQLFLMPEFQNQGIGTAILHALVDESDRERLPLVLRVFKRNPARDLYERFGFKVDSEDDISYCMRRQPRES